MDLLDRYLAAVGLFLPLKQRADITAELRDELLARREEKESLLGRPLMPGEDADVFRAFGHPVIVAARFGPQQYLIGPQTYPIYALAMKAILAIVVVGVTIGGIAQIIATGGEPGPAIARWLGALWQGTVATVGALTIIFWLLERNHVRLRLFDRWDPNDLPDASKARIKPPSVAEAIAGIIAGGVFLSWWTGLLGFEIPPIHTRQGYHLYFVMAPVWSQLYWPIILLVLGRIALHIVRIVQGAPWTRLSLGCEFVLHGAGLVLLAWLLRNGPWMTLSAAGDRPADILAALPPINLGLQIAMIVLVVISLAALAMDAWRFWRLSASQQSGA